MAQYSTVQILMICIVKLRNPPQLNLINWLPNRVSECAERNRRVIFYLQHKLIFLEKVCVVFWSKVRLHPTTKVCSDIACSDFLSCLKHFCTVCFGNNQSIDGFPNWQYICCDSQQLCVTADTDWLTQKLDITTNFLLIKPFVHIVTSLSQFVPPCPALHLFTSGAGP